MKRPVETLTSDAAPNPGRTLLDWPREAGVTPDLKDLIRQQLKKQRRRRKIAVQTGALGLFLALLVAWGVPYLRYTNSVETAPGRRQTLALADGSQVELSARTSLRSDFRSGRRQVALTRGEAYFSVTVDATHPFLVETPACAVRVLGTRFNVRVAEKGAVEITVIDGAVALEVGGSAPVRLAPGQQFASGDASVRALSATEITGVTAWLEGSLALDGLTLAEVANRVAAYHGKPIEVAPNAANFRPGGTFYIDDLPTFLSGLKAVLPVQIIKLDDGGYRISAR